jgi:hypothetical protein
MSNLQLPGRGGEVEAGARCPLPPVRSTRTFEVSAETVSGLLELRTAVGDHQCVAIGFLTRAWLQGSA